MGLFARKCRRHKCPLVKEGYEDIKFKTDVTGPYWGEKTPHPVTRYRYFCPKCREEELKEENAELEAGRLANEAEAKKRRREEVKTFTYKCQGCSRILDSRYDHFCPDCGTPHHCQCNHVWQEGEKFCSNCGAKKSIC